MTEFDSAMKKVTEMLHAAARKSGEVFENTKISYTISTERDKISKLQRQIGARLYRVYKEGGAVPEFILADLEAIQTIEETIHALEKTMAETKSFKFCPECGAKLELDNVYCPKCGAKQSKPVWETPTDAPERDASCSCDACKDGADNAPEDQPDCQCNSGDGDNGGGADSGAQTGL
ncbi:MAG: zinc ribbon domain-containing protein [Clostridiales bacterium]|jgi:ribosomal protein L40E|nr:zinc ribbon domain-containing protein [Clostridiales bacterium]